MDLFWVVIRVTKSSKVGGSRLTNARWSTDIREWTKPVSECPPIWPLCVWGGSWCIINKKFAVIYWLIPVMKHDCRWPSHNMYYLMFMLLSSEAYVLILLSACSSNLLLYYVLTYWWAKFEWYDEVSIIINAGTKQRLDGAFI